MANQSFVPGRQKTLMSLLSRNPFNLGKSNRSVGKPSISAPKQTAPIQTAPTQKAPKQKAPKQTAFYDKGYSSLERSMMEQKEDALSLLGKQYESQAESLRSGYGNGMSSIDNLLSLLDPTYQAMQKEQEESLNKEKANDLARLQSEYASRGIGDSEQATQGFERSQRGYVDALNEFLTKLSIQKEQERVGYQNKKLDLNTQLQQSLSDALSGRYQGEFDVTSNTNNSINQLREANLARRQEFQNSIALANARNPINLSSPRSGASATGMSSLDRSLALKDRDLKNAIALANAKAKISNKDYQDDPSNLSTQELEAMLNML